MHVEGLPLGAMRYNLFKPSVGKVTNSCGQRHCFGAIMLLVELAERQSVACEHRCLCSSTTRPLLGQREIS